MRFFLRVSGAWGDAQAQWSPWEQQGQHQLIVTVGFCTGRGRPRAVPYNTYYSYTVRSSIGHAPIQFPPWPQGLDFGECASLLAWIPLKVEREWAFGWDADSFFGKWPQGTEVTDEGRGQSETEWGSANVRIFYNISHPCGHLAALQGPT